MKVALVQDEPAHLDLVLAVDETIRAVQDASKRGAQLVIFGESWLTGYPAWLDYGKNLNRWNDQVLKSVYGALVENSPYIDGPEINALKSAAVENNIHIYIGLHERHKSGRSLFNSILCISKNGKIVSHHRKMVPTFTEKLFHKPSESFDLTMADVEGFRVGGLICWEHWMPLARQYYHDLGEQIHIAFWPNVHEMHQVASRHYAFEGRCFVFAIGQIFSKGSIPEQIDLDPDDTFVNDSLLRGGSCVIAPDGQYLLEPQWDNRETFIVEIDSTKRISEESLTLDVSGHYARPDLFNFGVKKD